VVDNSRHIAHTGVPVTPILENLDALDAAGVDIWIRLPFIPGVNDDEENLAEVAGVVNGLEHVSRVHLLPFHATGNDKHGRLGRAGSCGGDDGPSRDSLDVAAQILTGHGLDVHVGG
jgi:pyruvate formate lyase activating enzyme